VERQPGLSREREGVWKQPAEVHSTGTLVLDVETRYLASEVGGWGNIQRLRVAVAVAYSSETDRYLEYMEDDVRDLISLMQTAQLIVGYNVLRFDYEVLQAYTSFRLSSLPTLDLMQHLQRTLGWRPKLNSVALATLGQAKTGDGLQSVRWFRTGEISRVIEYCRQDVAVTWQIYRFGKEHGFVYVHKRAQGRLQVPVRW
jgi:DEAD/DEAH box helicase domain-containing protein